MTRDLRLRFWLRVMDVGAWLDEHGFGDRVWYWAIAHAGKNVDYGDELPEPVDGDW
jgi:hypothetical protein